MRARLTNQMGAGDEPAARQTLRQVWEMIVEGSAGKGLGEMRLRMVQVMAIANRGAHGGGADPDRLHGDAIEVLDAFAQADSEARLPSISMDGVAKLAALVRANGGPGGKIARRAVEYIGAHCTRSVTSAPPPGRSRRGSTYRRGVRAGRSSATPPRTGAQAGPAQLPAEGCCACTPQSVQ